VADEGEDGEDGAQAVGRLRLRGTVLDWLWSDGTLRESFDLAGYEPEVELKRRLGCAGAFTAAVVALVAAALKLDVRLGWIVVAPVALFLLSLLRASLVPGVFLSLRADGGERERIPLGSDVGPEEFVLFYARIVKAARRARQGDEGEDDDPPFERAELDDYYRPMAIVLRDGRVAFALTCRDVPQLVEAAGVYYRAAVRSIRAGREGWRGPVLFRVNPEAPTRTPEGVRSLESCLAECRAWSVYSGPPIGVSWEWD
jgi:hypothetical protein